ncbi:MAG: glycosyltransferase, partial [Actinobacteria bacterium]|nr:glycosyltransferase [Actinomycetota bacterium]
MVLLVYEPTDYDAATPALVRRQVYGGPVTIAAIDSSADSTRPNNAAIQAAVDRWEAIAPAEFGHGATRNRAADACTTPLIVYLSQDAHPMGDGWLSALTAPLVGGAAVAAYGRQRPPGGDAEREATFGFLYPDEPEIKTKADIARLGLRAFHFSDVTSAFVADVLRRTRFPEDIPTFEDIGVAKRLLDDGHALAYVPDAVVEHGAAMAGRRLVRRYRQIGAVYEHLGIFSDLRRATGRGLLSQG